MVNLSNPVIRIRAKVVNFRPEAINKFYGLPDTDPREYDAKNYAIRS